MRALFVAAVVAGGIAVAAPAVNAQSAAKVYRIGYLSGGSATTGVYEQFRQGLHELGWVEGRNLVIDRRFAEGRYERLPELAAELIGLNADLIVAAPSPAALAARKATAKIPIVMANVGDPVGLGLIESLAHPGGNVTGTAFAVGLETFDKALELLKAALPGVRTVAVLSNPSNPGQVRAAGNLKKTAPALGLRPLFVEARGADDLDRAFATAKSGRAEAIFVITDPLFILHRTQLAELARRNALPSMYGVRDGVDAGGLMSFGPSLAEGSRRAAIFVDKILKGAKPADLPVEQPSKFELVINLKTAKALGVAIPQPLLLRADEIIQ